MSQMTQRAVKGDITVPHGNILLSDKWRNTQLAEALKGKCKVTFEPDLGVVDFHPSSKVGVVYVPESEMIGGGAGYRKKLVRLRKADTCRGVVMAERTVLTSQYYQAMQKFVMLELGLVLYPVTSQADAAMLLSQMVSVECKPDNNPFLRRSEPTLDDTEQQFLTTLQTIPNLGNVKAKLLLQHFPNIAHISQATIEELAPVIGQSSAYSVTEFFQHQLSS